MIPHGEEVFDWDDANREYVRRHGVEPEECEQALDDPAWIGFAARTEAGEPRRGIVGETAAQRTLVIIFTLREDRVRVVTAWPASGWQRRAYRGAKQ